MFAPIHREKKKSWKFELAKIQNNTFVWSGELGKNSGEFEKNVTLDLYENYSWWIGKGVWKRDGVLD